MKKERKMEYILSANIIQLELAEKLVELVGENSDFRVDYDGEEEVTVSYLKKRRFWLDKEGLLLRIKNNRLEAYWRVPTVMLNMISKYMEEKWIKPISIRKFSEFNKECPYKDEKWMKSKKKKVKAE